MDTFDVSVTANDIFYSVCVCVCAPDSQTRFRRAPSLHTTHINYYARLSRRWSLVKRRTLGTNTVQPPSCLLSALLMQINGQVSVYQPHMTSSWSSAQGSKSRKFSVSTHPEIISSPEAYSCHLKWAQFHNEWRAFFSLLCILHNKDVHHKPGESRDKTWLVHVLLKALSGPQHECCPCQIEPNIMRKTQDSHPIKVLSFIMYIIISLHLICNGASAYAEIW